MAELTVTADDNNLEAVQDFIREQIGFACENVKTLMQIDLAIEEIFVNIAHYAYTNGGDVTIKCDFSDESHILTVVFLDSGKQFDPLAKPDPDVTASAEDRGIGGLGIFLTKKYMDNVKYSYTDGKNVLTIEKTLD